MTRMSEMHGALEALFRHNVSESGRGSPLARTVHEFVLPMGASVSMLVMMMLVGCVIPPSLEISQDAGVNSPPAILSVTSDQQALPEPGPVAFGQQTMDALSISLIDTDPLDVLYVGIYVDYNAPDRLAARAKCMAPPSTNPLRTATCRLNSLCVDADIGVTRNMTIVVFDRPPDDSGNGDPPFQAMTMTDGLSTSRFYFLNCRPAQL